MKKKLLTKKLLAGVLGVIFCFTLLPLSNVKLLRSAFASEPKTEYTGVDHSPSNNGFNKTEGTEGTKLTDWSIILDADTEDGKGYTTAGGAQDTNISNFENTFSYNYAGDSLIKELEKRLGTLTEEQKETIKSEVCKNLNAPLNSNYEISNSTSTNLVLMLNAGKIVSITESGINFADREVYYYAKSDKKISLSSYAFYKVSVEVYVEGTDTKASIKLSGDISETLFENISESTNTNKVYRYKVTNDLNNTITYFNSTDNGASDVTDATTDAENPITYTRTVDGENVSYTYTSGDTTYTAVMVATGDSGKWVTYTAYISTGYKSDTHSVFVELGLGTSDKNRSTGRVYFDNVKVTQIQYADFVNNAAKNDTTTVIDNRGIFGNTYENDTNKHTKFNCVTNFNDTSKTPENYGWTIEPNSDGSEYETTFAQLVKEKSRTIYDTFNENNGALYIANTTDNNLTVKTAKFALDQFRYYRISFFVRSDYNAIKQSDVTIKANIYAKLNSGDKETEKSLSEAYSMNPYDSNSTNSTSQSNSNYWKEVVLYVQSCPIYSTEAYLTISVSANGKIYLDQLTTEYTTATEYESASSNRKLSLNTTLKSDNITNGHFYYSSTTTLDYTTPLAVKNWSKEQLNTKADIYAYYENNSNEHYTSLLRPAEVTISGDTLTYNTETYTRSAEADKENEFLTAAKKIVVIKDVEFTYNADMKNYISEKYDKFTLFTDTPNAYYGIINSNNDNYQSLLNIDAMSVINSNNNLENYLAISNQEAFNLGISYTSSKFSLSKNTYQRLLVQAYTNNLNGKAKIELLNSDKEVVCSIDLEKTAGWRTYELYCHTADTSGDYYLRLSLGNKTDMELGSTVLFKNVKYTSTTSKTFQEKQNLSASERTTSATADLGASNYTELGEKLTDTTFKALLVKNNITENAGELLILDTTQADAENPVANYKGYTIKKYSDDSNPYILVIDNAANQTSEIETIVNNELSADKYYKITVIVLAKDLQDGTTATIEFGDKIASLAIKNSEEFTEYTVYIKTGKDKVTTSPVIKLNGEGKLFIDSITVASSSSSELTTARKDSRTNPDTIKVTDLSSATTGDKDDNNESKKESHTVEILCATLSSILLVGAIIFALVFTRVKNKKKQKDKQEFNKVSSKDDTKGFV